MRHTPTPAQTAPFANPSRLIWLGMAFAVMIHGTGLGMMVLTHHFGADHIRNLHVAKIAKVPARPAPGPASQMASGTAAGHCETPRP